jgi:hypothetical protein
MRKSVPARTGAGADCGSACVLLVREKHRRRHTRPHTPGDRCRVLLQSCRRPRPGRDPVSSARFPRTTLKSMWMNMPTITRIPGGVKRRLLKEHPPRRTIGAPGFSATAAGEERGASGRGPARQGDGKGRNRKAPAAPGLLFLFLSGNDVAPAQGAGWFLGLLPLVELPRWKLRAASGPCQGIACRGRSRGLSGELSPAGQGLSEVVPFLQRGDCTGRTVEEIPPAPGGNRRPGPGARRSTAVSPPSGSRTRRPRARRRTRRGRQPRAGHPGRSTIGVRRSLRRHTRRPAGRRSEG